MVSDFLLERLGALTTIKKPSFDHCGSKLAEDPSPGHSLTTWGASGSYCSQGLIALSVHQHLKMSVPPKCGGAYQGTGISFSDGLVTMGLTWSWRRLPWSAPFQVQVTGTVTAQSPSGPLEEVLV